MISAALNICSWNSRSPFREQHVIRRAQTRRYHNSPAQLLTSQCVDGHIRVQHNYLFGFRFGNAAGPDLTPRRYIQCSCLFRLCSFLARNIRIFIACHASAIGMTYIQCIVWVCFFGVLSFGGCFVTCVVCLFNEIIVFSFLNRYIQWYIHEYDLQ